MGGLPLALLFSFEQNLRTVADLVIFQKKVVGVSEPSLNRFILRARRAVGLRGQVNVLVTGNSTMRALNLRFRKQNKATDVLSFASHQPPGKARRIIAGDIAISADIARQNAIRLGHSAAAEVKVLTLHGMLHLAGMNHERDNGQMARKEASLRRVLGLPATLIERVQPANSSRSQTETFVARGTRRTR